MVFYLSYTVTGHSIHHLQDIHVQTIYSDVETGDRGHSRSSKISLFDSLAMVSYALTVSEKQRLMAENRPFSIPPYLCFCLIQNMGWTCRKFGTRSVLSRG